MNHEEELQKTMNRLTTELPAEDRNPKRDEYRGNPLLVLPMGENREFSFGVGKARAILKFIDSIKEFVAEYELPEAK